MMTDRELLEWAAKAAGINGVIKATADGAYWLFRDDFGTPWNPLTDDSDALRLAVRLDMLIDSGRGGCHIRFSDRTPKNSLTELSSDTMTATRRAIVRAAAEIGRSQHTTTGEST